MKKRTLLAVCAVTAAITMTVGLTACNNNNGNGGMSAEDAAAKIATFTGSPNTVNATFKQTFKLDVNDSRPGLDSFRKDVSDTVKVEIDYTAGNLYYYAKKTTKQNDVSEQLVVKEDSTYYFLTTTTAKQALADETAAKTKIDELLSSFTRANSGYIDGEAFVYSTDWVHDYLLLGSGTVNGTEKSYFTYNYAAAENDGLKIGIDLKYVGYYTDGGSSEIGVDATHTGATAEIVTNSKGYITSFSETMNNHLDMAIANPPFPLDYTGTRSLTATYDGAITKKSADDIEQDLVPGTIVLPQSVEHATVQAFNFKQGDFSTLTTPSETVDVGNYVAVKVTCETGYEVASVTVNGQATTNMNGYHCLMTPAESGVTYTVAVVVKAEGEEAPTTGTIVASAVDHATVKTYDFTYSQNITADSFKEGTTVEAGHFVAVKVECESGYEVDTVKVNGTAANPINGYYCLMQAATAGTTYNVVVTVKPEGGSSEGDATVGTIVVDPATVTGCTIQTYDFTYSQNITADSFKEGTTVEPGHFVAVKVTLENGYTVASVKINGSDAMLMGGYYCVVSQPVVAGTTYTVVVTLTQA